MAQQERIIPRKINLAKSTNYRLNLGPLPLTNFWLTTCNLPTVSSNEVIIPHPVHGQLYRPSNTSVVAPMTVTFLVDEDYANYMEILTLMYKASGPEMTKRFKPGERDTFTGTLHILSNNKNVSETTFNFHGLFPTILGELQMTNESSEPLLTDLTFQYDYMTFETGTPPSPV
jgi:hypothetical protein